MTSLNDKAFEGKVAFVNGAASGIGRATALVFAEAGASVAAIDEDQDGIDLFVQQIDTAGGKVIAVRCGLVGTAAPVAWKGLSDILRAGGTA